MIDVALCVTQSCYLLSYSIGHIQCRPNSPKCYGMRIPYNMTEISTFPYGIVVPVIDGSNPWISPKMAKGVVRRTPIDWLRVNIEI